MRAPQSSSTTNGEREPAHQNDRQDLAIPDPERRGQIPIGSHNLGEQRGECCQPEVEDEVTTSMTSQQEEQRAMKNAQDQRQGECRGKSVQGKQRIDD